MRVQLQCQALRLRIDEDELARLLAGEPIANATRWPDGSTSSAELILGEADGWERHNDGWRATLAAAPVRELASRLPSRDGLRIELQAADSTPLEVLFDIDVRDSTHRRYPNKHREHP